MSEILKTLLVDDSCTVAELIKMIAAKIGLTNSDEYALISEDELEKPFKKGKGGWGQKKMDKVRKKWHIEDERKSSHF